ncbi:Non-lysosomal glucosylceramidase [Nesidiocoris tenuis]|uniref:Non-lysosomal glucosylceramidase n=1 Tax=Nesidiocoris tenuis TaxID=355587 RepID=A0ABN7AEH7_9HEMI|nr:Non-lysosomal glucosylceramidase [Nesidiocoris tenuis]
MKKDTQTFKWTNPSTVPPYGWKASSDYVFPQKRTQKFVITLHQLKVLLPLIFRYVWDTISLWCNGRKPVMNFFSVVENRMKSGVPLGGMGAGSIGRGYKGEFCRFHMEPGEYKYSDVIADQFIATIYNEKGERLYQKVLSTCYKPKWYSCLLDGWDWSFPAKDLHFTALYPQAWYEFYIKNEKKNINLKLTCHQISPVIPHNYKDSSLPVAVFEWAVENNSTTNCQVSITMTIRDGDGSRHCGRKRDKTSEEFDETCQNGILRGVTIKQNIGVMPCNYSIASLQTESTVVKRCLYFDPCGDGKKFWDSIPSDKFEKPRSNKGRPNFGVGIKTLVKLNGLENDSSICFAFSWDMPKVRFPMSSTDHLRYYTQFFGSDGEAGRKICQYSIDNFKRWTNDIYNWQITTLSDERLPDWYKSALFNELYYVSDGGTLWILLDEEESRKLPDDDPRNVHGRFAYLEGHEYKMYNTYDVHFYASFALAMLWPGLQKSIQYDFRDSILAEDKTPVWYLYDGEVGPRKVKDTVPHDVGQPDGDPFNVINVYPVHDVSMWKDLNVKFVLQVYRDFTLTHDLNYLRDLYPQVVLVMNKSLQWDFNGEGVIQNGGFPDQTYDTWIMQGVSAYCGGLWIAAVAVTVKMAEKLNDEHTYEKFRDILARGKKSFDEKLWNGKYYLFDSSGDIYSDTIMSDQLCGLWYLKASQVEDEVFVKSHALSALRCIYDNNVLKYFGGCQGAVNGMRPNGEIDRTATQSEESWTGVTYALASTLIFEGMVDEGLNTAKGLYETIFDKAGLGFATPEALHGLDSYRAVGYMRPLSIWSIQHAINDLPLWAIEDGLLPHAT